MGCYSSAPSILVPHNANTSDKNMPLAEDKNKKESTESDRMISEDANETKEINVLPTCDTIAEPIQLVRKKNSFIEAASLEKDKVCQKNGHVIEDNKSIDSSEIPQEDNKISTLEEVVEKVIHLNSDNNIKQDVTNDGEDEPENFDEDKNSDNTKAIDDEVNPVPEITEYHTEIEASEQSDEHLEEAISPSQSESSRATRWEALADIAAELPPSLAVDPITGQIYSLSK